MTVASRPWYRSPALWFLLPGVVFIMAAWVFSMQRWAEVDVEAGGYSVQLENDGSSVALNWQKTPPPFPPFTAPPPKPFSFHVRKHWSPASKEWFPLPSYLVTSPESPHALHNLEIPHWFLLLVYVGLWQLPWLVRYHRRRQIERSLATVPVEGAGMN